MRDSVPSLVLTSETTPRTLQRALHTSPGTSSWWQCTKNSNGIQTRVAQFEQLYPIQYISKIKTTLKTIGPYPLTTQKEITCLEKWRKNETIMGHNKLRSWGWCRKAKHGAGNPSENLGETPGGGVHNIHRRHNLTFIVHNKLNKQRINNQLGFGKLHRDKLGGRRWMRVSELPRRGRGIREWVLRDWTTGCLGERVEWWKAPIGERWWESNFSRRGKWVPNRIVAHSRPWIGLCKPLHRPNLSLPSESTLSLSPSHPFFAFSFSPLSKFKQNHLKPVWPPYVVVSKPIIFETQRSSS